MVMFVELDMCYIVCPKRLKSALERIRRSEHILQRGFCGLKVFYCSNIQMAITSVNSCLLEGEVPNAASWTLVSWQYQTGKNGAGWLTGKRSRWAIRSERASVVAQHTPQQPRPPAAAIHRPFLHTLLLETLLSFASTCPRHYLLHATLLLMLSIALAVRGRRRATNAPM